MPARRTRALPGLLLTALLAGVGVASVLVASPQAQAAERTITERLDRVEGSVVDVEGRITRLENDYSLRRGLIGSEEALQRYEDAVFVYLVGEYEDAASAFYTLVESESLSNEALARDSQWYLAECLFELENYTTALDVYERIIASGKDHPFLEDAVLRELEIYGILRDNEAFYDVYQRWYLSGKLQADDRVKYTVAKSFYRQGDLVRAKSMFTDEDLGPSSPYFGRARYFLGTILADEGAFEPAIAEFLRVASLEGSEDPAVMELTFLALGRLYYEVGNYGLATDYYQKIGSDSQYFADQLYELVWTFIKQDRWPEAIEHVEIFLIAFPEHRYSMQLLLNQGHLHMKEADFEKALASYETVVDSYTPLNDRLAALEASREDPAAFFKRLVSGSPTDESQRLPSFAMDMLVDDPIMGRMVEVHTELSDQVEDLALTDQLIADVVAALAGGNESIGTFNRGRGAIERAGDDALTLRARLIETELDFLQNNGAGASTQALRTEWDVLKTRSVDVQGQESDRTDRFQVFSDQVREVQGEALRIDQLRASLEAEVAAVQRLLSGKSDQLSAEDLSLVQAGLAELSAELQAIEAEATSLQSSASRSSVLATVPRGRSTSLASQRGLLAGEYGTFRDKLRSARNSVAVAERGVVFSRLDELWVRLDKTDAKGERTMNLLDDAEGTELAILRKRLASESAEVALLHTDLDGASLRSDELSLEVTRAGFGRLQGKVYNTVMEADKGIVDVYWIRKSDVSDEITRLSKERGRKLDELNNRFNVIRQKLEE